MPSKEKVIFYFEDEPELLDDYIEMLCEKYNVIVSANKMLVEKERQEKIDLLIVDLMIRPVITDEEGNDMRQNLGYPGIDWKRTGVEFLKRVRAGDYEAYGFSSSVPAVAATVRVENTIREEVEKAGIEAYLEKPFSMDELEQVVDTILIH